MDKEIRKRVYKKYKGCCAYCGNKIEYKSMQVDHIIPQSNFATDTFNERIKDLRVPNFLKHLDKNDVNHIDNLNPSCRKCNNFKSSFTLELFRSELSCQLERTRKTSSNYRRALQFGQVVETPKPIKFFFEQMFKTIAEHSVKVNENFTLEDELYEFLYWYQRAPLDNKSMADIIQDYFTHVRKEE